jgi:hypothetical protein
MCAHFLRTAMVLSRRETGEVSPWPARSDEKWHDSQLRRHQPHQPPGERVLQHRGGEILFIRTVVRHHPAGMIDGPGAGATPRGGAGAAVMAKPNHVSKRSSPQEQCRTRRARIATAPASGPVRSSPTPSTAHVSTVRRGWPSDPRRQCNDRCVAPEALASCVIIPSSLPHNSPTRRCPPIQKITNVWP